MPHVTAAPKPVAAALIPLHPTHAAAVRRARHRLHIAIVVSGLCMVAAIVLGVLYATKGTHVYAPVFEGVPADPTDVLDCEGNGRTYWAAAHGHATTQCIFSGDMTLPGRKGVTEAEVVAMCNARTDCGGYTVRTVSSYSPCAACAGVSDPGGTTASCATVAYNKGQPEYTLVGKRAVQDVRQVSGVTQGALHEVRTVTYVRQ